MFCIFCLPIVFAFTYVNKINHLWVHKWAIYIYSFMWIKKSVTNPQVCNIISCNGQALKGLGFDPLGLVCKFEGVVYIILECIYYQLQIVAFWHIVQKSEHIHQFNYIDAKWNELLVFLNEKILVAHLLYILIFFIVILCYLILFLGC